jgi:RIO kinase 1
VTREDKLEKLEHALWKIHSNGRGGGVREERKTESEVWDRATLDAVYRFMKRGLVDTVEFPISTGKEANVFYALSPEGGPLVVKVYRTSTADFRAVEEYIMGDPRFPGRRSNRRQVIYAWARKEMLNLRLAREAGVPVPVPIDQYRNVLAMEYVGDEERAAPELRQVRLEDPEGFLEEVLDAAATLLSDAKLVHGDLSEYNILVRDGSPVLIDLGQAMLLRHPRSPELLERDCRNVAKYFGRLGVDTSPGQVRERLVSGLDLEGDGDGPEEGGGDADGVANKD